MHPNKPYLLQYAVNHVLIAATLSSYMMPNAFSVPCGSKLPYRIAMLISYETENQK